MKILEKDLHGILFDGHPTFYGLCLYLYIYMVTPPPRAYLCPLLVEGVNSTLCASFLQMRENTVKYSVVVAFLPSI